jgi:hypothetical protein
MEFNNIKIVFLITLASALLPGGAAAQTWDEFFSQKEKQHDYDMDQLIVLGVNWAKAMNTLIAVGDGLGTINNIAEGNFNLSRDFFGHLNNVSPEIANSAKVADIIMFQYYITRDMGRVWTFCAGNTNFTAQEIRYVEKVHANFLVLTDANISELMRIIAPGERTMTDAERMQQIDRIYEEMCEEQAFVKSFSDDVYGLSRERQKETNSISNRIY